MNSHEIQCNNITTSNRLHHNNSSNKKTRDVRLALKKIITKTLENQNSSTILELVKYNLQNMCVNKSVSEQTSENEHHNHKDEPEEDYNSARSRCTKELLRKTILEKRHYHHLKEHQFCMHLRQKIWRPW